MHPTTSSAHAKDYFTSSLQPGDYYLNQQELQGHFYGLLSERLGITGPTDKETFFALCDNRSPITGGNLTPRNKAHRTIAYDISFHAPKSVSVVSALSEDDHIRKAFQESVRQTMSEMEKDMMTRVRRKGKDEDRYTGEMLISEFLHQTSRPAEGNTSDPHLHIHNLVQNVTWDAHERRYKAGQFREINRSMPYYQQMYHKLFSDKLMSLGYKVRKTKSAFEIEGVPAHVIDLFSKRTNEIGQFAKEHGITDAKSLDELGARTRGKKQKDLSMAELEAEWRRQIKEASAGQEDKTDVTIRHNRKILCPELQPQKCVDYAAKHSFERVSTISDRRLLEAAYRHSVGNNSVGINDITETFKSDTRFLHVKDGYQNICTTKEVLKEEKEMVILARNGQGRFRPLYGQPPDIHLDGQQQQAVADVLTTPNMVSIIRGVAGAGKTTTLTELHRHFKAAGKEPLYFAPTGQAARENLVKEGFANAETVARLLVDTKLQDQLKDQILIIDEAAMLGTQDMRKVLEIATQKQARVLLLGDIRQHNSVTRGDSLRVLTNFGKIKPAEISKIRRQRNEKYRLAVEDLSRGDVHAAFGKLSEINAIRQIDPKNPNAELVADYVATIKKGKSALIVSPTHQQGNAVTKDVRMQLKDEGLLAKKEIQALKLTSLNLTEAQKGDWRNFKSGQIIQFGLPAPQITRGSTWKVHNINEENIQITNKKGQTVSLPLNKAKAFDVYEASEIQLAKGEKVRITKGGFDKHDRRLNNGQTFEVISTNKTGDAKLRNKDSKAVYELKSDFGHIDHAYCTTSHSAQGKTVDEVFVSQPAATFAATDKKQIYVSVSRGRNMVTIYTDDKEQLLEHAERSGDRQSALELVAKGRARQSYGRHPNLEKSHVKINEKSMDQPKTKNPRHIDYEP
jgi:conjugative relaxase-like TrwC/TraI family protein